MQIIKSVVYTDDKNLITSVTKYLYKRVETTLKNLNVRFSANKLTFKKIKLVHFTT